MSEEISLKRLFKGDDNALVQSLSVIHGLFVADLAAFTAFDSTFTPEWAAQWLADIETASIVESDHTRKAEVMDETEQVEDLMQQGRAKWAEAKYFIKKAFPRDAAMLHLFGAAAYAEARMNQPKMVEFLLGLHSTATEHAAALIAVGYSQERIDEIQGICDALLARNDAQNKARRGRPKLTAQRIAALNAPYRKLMLVSEAAQIVFINSAAKQKQYLFLPGRKRKKKGEAKR